MLRIVSVVLALSFSMLSCGVGVEGEEEVADPNAPVQVQQEVVNAPRDASSGLATGRRQHLPLTLTME